MLKANLRMQLGELAMGAIPSLSQAYAREYLGMEPEASAEGSVPRITLAGTEAALAGESANPLTVLTKMVSACRNSKRHLVNSQKEPLHEQRAVDL
jgi:hypothetical protein